MNKYLLFTLVFGLGSLLIWAVPFQNPFFHLNNETPADTALSNFQIAEGFQIELVASEPLVADPVAMEIDEEGRMYVVEMHGYPLDLSGSGKVKILTDTDGDGKMDQSTLFADGLMLPTGVMRWKKGILVTDAPYVLYLEDSDGDNRADKRDTLLSGFARSNPQHNLNNPLYGLDNWIYLGHESAISTQSYQKEFGDDGSEIHFPKHKSSPRLPKNANGRGVRLKPDQRQLEELAAGTQFGHTFDPWGRYFVVSNANHAIHQAVRAEYLTRNPYLLVGDAQQAISDHGRAAEVFSITQNPENQLLTDVGVFTSACGSLFYQGGLFPSSFDSVLFVAEPVSNLVHADVVREKGATFTASRLYANKEFLASTDGWFRPVNTYLGPDGALYLVDYYRQIIEHPEWMADEVIRSGALYNGTDKGRIYRITPKGTPQASWAKGLAMGKMTDSELVQKLTDPSLWWRRNAQRLLVDRNAVTITKELEFMVESAGSALGKLHALWTLEGTGQLTPRVIKKALKDPFPGIRENAIILSEKYTHSDSDLNKTLISLSDDPNAKVRYQLLCSLGSLTMPEAVQAREKLLFKDIGDPWVRVAALSAKDFPAKQVLYSVLLRQDQTGSAFIDFIEQLSNMSAMSGTIAELHPFISNALSATTSGNELRQAAVLTGIAKGLKENKQVANSFSKSIQEMLVKAAIGHSSVPVREGCVKLLRIAGIPEGPVWQSAQQIAVAYASNAQANPEYRTVAVKFLTLKHPQKYSGLFEELIVATEPLALQLTALRALASLNDETVCHFATSHWNELTPELRNAAIDAFLANDARIAKLLDALEEGIIDPAVLGWPRSVNLMNQGNRPLRARSRKLLTAQNTNKEEVLRRYEAALNSPGNWEKGKTVFASQCSACHQIGGEMGTAFGPDLATIRNRSQQSILGDILDPNFSIADGYDLWTIQLNDGATLTGLIASETPTALTLRSFGGIETNVARSRISSIKAMKVSVMPNGLESQIDPLQMSDLLAFLKQQK